jgi:pimeloyl-ACP methyl ester carboxylesterase
MNSLKASDGTSVPVTWTNDNHDIVFLFCHGITSDREEDGVFSDFHSTYLSDFSDAFYFDFRGHGESSIPSEKATIQGMRDDFRTSIAFLNSEKYRKIIVVAASFGASIVLLESAAIHQFGVRDVVFWNPVVSYNDTFVNPGAEWARAFFPGTQPRKDTYSAYIYIPETDFIIGPQMAREIATLFPEVSGLPKETSYFCIHGTSDKYVPFSSTEKFCQRNPNNTMLYELIGATHGFPNHIYEVYSETTKWIKARLK